MRRITPIVALALLTVSLPVAALGGADRTLSGPSGEQAGLAPLPGTEGSGYKGASTCYEPGDLLTRYSYDGYEEGEFVPHGYVDYYWLPYKQANLDWTCERFEGGHRVDHPTAGDDVWVSLGGADGGGLNGLVDEFDPTGQDGDFDGDGQPGPFGGHYEIIENVTPGNTFVLHTWSPTDMFWIGFYDENGDYLWNGDSFPRTTVGDNLGQIPNGAEFARVFWLQPSAWERPDKPTNTELGRFDYFEVSFQGAELCSREPVYKRAEPSDYEGVEPMAEVASGEMPTNGWMLVNFTYEPGSPLSIEWTLHEPSSALWQHKIKLDGRDLRSGDGSGNPGGWSGNMIHANGPAGPNVTTDQRSATPLGFLSKYSMENREFGLSQGAGEYSVLYWSMGGNADKQTFTIRKDTCGTEASQVTSVISSQEVTFVRPSDFDGVDAQVGVGNFYTGEGAWAKHGSYETSADHNLFAWMYGPEQVCGDDGIPTTRVDCLPTVQVDPNGPPGTDHECGDGCFITGPAGGYDIEITEVQQTPTGADRSELMGIMDVPWPSES